jgi:hypothetical protein
MSARAARRNDVRNPGGEDPRLAHACAGENENRPVQRFDRATLLLVQPFEVGGLSILQTSGERGACDGV